MGTSPKYVGMKTNLVTWIIFFGLLSGNPGAQTTVSIKIDQMLGSKPFAYGPIAEAELGYYFKVSRLQYYVSEITLIHDGGQHTPVTDLHLLIDPAKDSIFTLGVFPISQLEQIEFWIGVDSAHNHLDPSLYPENHPLALHDPSMHWGWAGGYRFIAFEGVAGFTPGFLSGNFQIHTIGDENYRKILLDVNEIISADSIIIPIQADYAMLLRRMDVSLGWESHSSVGKSKQISMNMRDVFTTEMVSSTYQPEPESLFSISPNPADDYFTVTLRTTPSSPLTLTGRNLQGNKILSSTIHTSPQDINFNMSLVPGIYFLTLSDGPKTLGVEKIIVH